MQLILELDVLIVESVQFQKLFILLLECLFLVMLLLIVDIRKHPFQHGFRNGVSSIPCLPGKFFVNEVIVIYEMGAAAFNLLDDLRNGFLRTQQKQTMNVIGHTIYDAHRAT